MSYLDPYGASTEPRGWERPDKSRDHERAGAPPGAHWSDEGEGAPQRPVRAGAAPNTFADRPPYDAAPPHRHGGAPPRGHGHSAADEYRPGPDERRPARGGPPSGPNGHPIGPNGYAPDRNGQTARPDAPYRRPEQPRPDLNDAYAGTGGPRPGGHDPHGAGPAGPYPGRGRSEEDADGPGDGVSPYPDRDAVPGEADVMAAPTNPVGWPLVDGAPPPEPPPPPSGRRGPGKRRASRTRPATAPASTGRAGRNLPAAIGVGVTLGAVVLLPLLLFRPGFVVVAAAAMAIGIWEMVRAMQSSGAQPPFVPLVAGGVLMMGLAWWSGPDALSLGLLVTVLAAMVWRLGDGPAGFQRDLTAIALIAVYVPFLGGFAVLLAVPSDGALRVVATLAAVVLSDTGGYAAGVAFGKHPMAPSVSPKKSWEGLGGSLLAAGLGSALLLWLLLDVEPWWGAVFGLAVSGAAVLGDLGESMIKRDLGIKDMSNLLPGHGGLMDRLDSILFAVPTAYLLLAIFAPAR